MSSISSSLAFAVCLTVLSGSIGAAFGRRDCSCEPMVQTDHRGSSLGMANMELVRPASPELGTTRFASMLVATDRKKGAQLVVSRDAVGWSAGFGSLPALGATLEEALRNLLLK